MEERSGVLRLAEDVRRRTPAWLADLLLAVLVAFLHLAGTTAKTVANPGAVLRPLSDLGHLGFLLLVLSGAVLAVRRRRPVTVFGVTALASLVYYALDFPDGPGWLGLFVAVYTLTALGDGRRSLVVAYAGIAVLAVGWFVANANVEPPEAMGWVFFRIVASAMCATLGETVRSRRVAAEQAMARADAAERTREEEARARVDAERLRIAREVHDTVAHAIAVINVQAGVTAHVLDRRPDRAREALETIEATSSRALQEMRSVLGVLRGAPEGDRAPSGGLDRLDELAAAGRDAGLDVRLVAPEPPGDVPTAVAGAAYRVVQESVTNAIRHAGPTQVRIAVGYDDGWLRVEVSDGGPRGAAGARPGPDAPPEAPGRGIAGMRERCRLLGGELEAAPNRSGGFTVAARLPLPWPGGAPA